MSTRGPNEEHRALAQLDGEGCSLKSYLGTRCYLAAGHGGMCDFLPPVIKTAAAMGEAYLRSQSEPIYQSNPLQVYRFAADEPKKALYSLEEIFRAGNQKHGNLDWKTHHHAEFLEKAQRHFLKRVLGERIDESGQPHLVHAAANLLLAAELENVWTKDIKK